jgi:hypothetical protein
MLVLQKDLWEKDKILKVLSDDKWSEKDDIIISDCVLNELKDLLLECIERNIKCILILDCNKGEVPPIMYLTRCATFLLGIKDIIRDSVYFSIIYDKLNTSQNWIDIILKLYKPVTPLFRLNSKSQILKICSDKEKVDFSYKLE